MQSNECHPQDTDRNLLFAVLALQADNIDHERFIQACTLWASRKETALPALLVELGWLSADDRADVERLVARKLKRHHGDARASLSEIAGSQARAALASVSDPDVERSLARLETTPPIGDISPNEPRADHAGRNLLFEEIGHGGMGIVLRGRDPELGRELAVKLLRPEHRGNAGLERRFLEEAQIAGQLQHPGVVPIYELGKFPDERPYFTMKLIKGRTLAEMLAERDVGLVCEVPDSEEARCKSAPQDLRRFLTIFEQVCQTLAYVHDKGVIHRDLKPANIMIGAFGEVQIMDWGLAKVLTRRDPGDPEGTLAGTLIHTARSDSTAYGDNRTGVAGTPAYMSPEQARGAVEAIDERADVFGLGGILCVILTGKPPQASRDRDEARRKASDGDLAEAFARLEACSAETEVVNLARACLAPNRIDRPRNAGEVAARLSAYLTGVQERLRQARLGRAAADARASEEAQTRRVAEAKTVVERHARRLTAGLAALLLLLIVFGGSGAWLFQQRRQQAGTAAALAMGEAKLLRDDGRFTEALAAARKAEELARTAGAVETVRQEAAMLTGEIESENAATQRDRRLLAALLEIHGPYTGPRIHRDEDGIIQLVQSNVEERFASAFREWDSTFDVDALTTEEAAARLRMRPRAVQTEVITALDAWASAPQQVLPVDRKRRITQLAEALDDSPGSRQGEVRRLLDRGKLHRERALAALALALRPVPVPFDGGLGEGRQRLRRLLENTDVVTEPTLDLLTLARALAVAGEVWLCEDLLRKAAQVRPQEVSLHHNLGGVRATLGRWHDAVECFAAARALRPELGTDLGEALIKSGRAEEGFALFRRMMLQQPENPWLRFVVGNALMGQARYEGAEAVLREAIRIKADYPQVHTNLGGTLYYQRKYQEAEVALRDAIRIKPDLAEARVSLGCVLRRLGRHEEAEASFREAIRHHPDDYLAHTNLGIALRDEGRYREAEAAFRKAVRVKPDFSDAHHALGHIVHRQGRYREAEAILREAIRLKPDNLAAHHTLGASLHNQGRYEEAEAPLREAIRLGSDSPEALRILGHSLSRQGRHEEAVSAFRAAMQLKPDDSAVYLRLGESLSHLGQTREAGAAFREAIRLQPDGPSARQAHRDLCLILNAQERYAEAEEACREMIHLALDHWVYTLLAVALNGQGKHEAAAIACREAIRLVHDFPIAHLALGNALHPQGRTKEAEAAYREAIRLRPDYQAAFNNLGMLLNALGRNEEAETLCRKAIRLKPDDPAAHYNLANTLDDVGRLEEAEAGFREAIRLKIDFAQAHCNLGHVLEKRGKFQEALQCFRRGHSLGIAKPNWKYASATWILQCERMIEVDRRLSAMLEGGSEPRSTLERLEMAAFCQLPCKRLHVTAARLTADAFTAEPRRANDLAKQYRYNAACSATLAVAGQAEDARLLPDRVKVKLRQQAYRWLLADLALYTQLLQRDDPRVKETLRQRLTHWRRDADLASVRDLSVLATLDGDERQQWRRLWQDVDALLRKLPSKK
jgi:tetratricopeptide (TPR) repeat protein